MDIDCCFLPLVCGCSDSVKPEGDPSQRICPKCNNVSVMDAKKKQMFELCCVPVFPMSSKRVWYCTICRWSVSHQDGWQPALPGAFHPPPPGAYTPGYAPNYAPGPGYTPGYVPTPGQGYYPPPPPGQHRPY